MGSVSAFLGHVLPPTNLHFDLEERCSSEYGRNVENTRINIKRNNRES
jgi:hypothetical protein